ncbi:3D-(3,5/4)-trihydroxycyclohexane-1,2-dione acylhydrolase (decyclizing) [Clostridium saccharobutylicum]|uniref:3D-(3,5/4)-trihydroxycyclohexane-1,2-dione hydrolase n=1 Tax=Clostridium saccharobutylicum DSM 13864 TaxID=1345695 RepID=U5MRZ5_CLOSA|nr:3D-(3,5/4)-trihydroxycyclohexane-1,2-dione acylhydrolase (decyclizing) [Clostridium saccharobutylicum]AGX42217.1 3D-(3,5/4)-trihydroxycyclohexane-1,2-dione hydrolase IolD [Clostridium saccharobutylicum DSM 13864]AQR89497.1 3D-(3,5/4)-trihydroxycyclohexane-1,2-dione hydrolase [Clostridium saccharobutylicum]AQR99399.1 3D-(3,5/4)-trihydroxycyclohexane-1,2-dione hydrolase [Clostridium saccharobutylicum]AQS09130.1 3D-(3,5/4)-trihydroxycyclohexane-1,2-dione hydrolase [Clostridium saccharobutylicum
MNSIKMTTAQALVKFLNNQYISFDGKEDRFIDGVFTIFGHGIVVGLGQALDENPGSLKVYQGRNEQGMAHVASAFAKQNNRRKIIACSTSIGPGAANMVTAAAAATVNNIPLLMFPGDSFATRQPDPVLQQLEQSYNMGITTNDVFKPVCKYWDRVSRPEQLMSAMINAMRVLTDPAETGAVCIALPQDVQGESFDFPEYFFKKRVYKITRPLAVEEEFNECVNLIKNKKKPIIICGGGVRYSEAGEVLEKFAERFNIPIAETQAGKSSVKSSCGINLGGIGVTGNLAANTIAKDADLVIGIGTRFSDFTTSSKALFKNKDVDFITINLSKFHGSKLDAYKMVGDAKVCIENLYKRLEKEEYISSYIDEIKNAKQSWKNEMDRLVNIKYTDNFVPIIKARNESSVEEFKELTNGTITQTAALGLIRKNIDKDAIVVGAAGSLPGDLQRMWETDAINSYHMEYGYSCMGYEIAASLGCKLADPDKEVYTMVGDGSYLMLHSELVTSLQEHKKINVLLFDNCGFGCINNLQMSNGIGNLATEFRYRNNDTEELNGGLIPIDFAKAASGYGVKTYTATTLEELENALNDAKKEKISTLIDIKVLPKTMTDGYESWWHVGLAEVSGKKSINDAFEYSQNQLKNAKKY